MSGLFAGGTFCYEAQLLLQRQLGPIRSNAPLRPELHVSGMAALEGHTCIDLGEDEFTQGRLHPMIDPDLRNLRLAQVAADPRVGVILLDVVLGYGAHPDPAGAACTAITAVRAAGHPVAFVASVCGTEGDPQRLSRQEETLRGSGVLVAPDNAAAARLAAAIVKDQRTP